MHRSGDSRAGVDFQHFPKLGTESWPGLETSYWPVTGCGLGPARGHNLDQGSALWLGPFPEKGCRLLSHQPPALPAPTVDGLWADLGGTAVHYPSSLGLFHWSSWPCCCFCLVARSCLSLCDVMNCSLARSSVYGIPQARIRSRLPFPPPGYLPDAGMEPVSLAVATGFLTTDPPGRPILMTCWGQVLLSSGPLFPGWGWASVTYLRSQLPLADGSPPCLQHAEPAFTSSASSPPSAPGVRGSQRGEDFWKVYPLQRRDILDCSEKDCATCLTVISLVSPVDNIVLTIVY